MKNIEDIEKMDLSDLEKVAADESISVPEGLEDRLKLSLLAQPDQAGEAADEGPSVRARLITGFSVLAAACLVAAVFLSRPQEKLLKDTFDDPYLAYAEVERTFERISKKMSKGTEKALSATEMIDKPSAIIRKINKK